MAKAQGYSPGEYLSKARNECSCITIASKQTKKTKKSNEWKEVGEKQNQGFQECGT
jgi:hypothetical protein